MCWPCGLYVLPLLSVSEWGEDTCTQAHTICAQLVAGTTHPLCPTYSYLTAIGSEGAVAPMFSLSYLSLSGGRIHIYEHIRYVRGWCLAPPTLSVLPTWRAAVVLLLKAGPPMPRAGEHSRSAIAMPDGSGASGCGRRRHPHAQHSCIGCVHGAQPSLVRWSIGAAAGSKQLAGASCGRRGASSQAAHCWLLGVEVERAGAA